MINYIHNNLNNSLDNHINSCEISFDTNPQPICILDIESHAFITVNNAAQTLYGYTMNEFKSMTIEDLMLDENKSNLKNSHQSKKCILNNMNEVMHKKKDGTILYLIIHTHVFNWNNGNACYAMITDITKQMMGKPVDVATILESVDVAKELLPFNSSMLLSEDQNAIHNFAHLKDEQRHRTNTIKLLDICNNATTSTDLITHVIAHFKNITECADVAIILRQVNGTLLNHTERNNVLLKRSTEDNCIDLKCKMPGSDELICAECICYNVLHGLTVTTCTESTPYGSAWHDACANPDDIAQAQNHCLFKQHESFLWVPIKSGNQTIGLLQFIDPKQHFFNTKMVSEIEEMSTSIGIALAKLNTENDLGESELFLKQVIKNANEGIVVLNSKGIVKLWNLYLCKLTGIEEHQVIGKNAMDVFPLFCDVDMSKRIAMTFDGLKTDPIEYNLTTSVNDTPIIVWDVLTPLTNVEGAINGAIGMIRDITDRKNADTHAQTFGRLYATLSQINQAIARTQTQEVLFQIICDVAIKHGQFSLAWIGNYNSENGSVVPIASSFGSGVSCDLNLLYASEPPFFNDDITYQAIKTKDVVICRNSLDDRNMLHWQNHAYGGNFQSAVAIPLFVNKKIVGVFNLYASKINLFYSVEETNLLREMGVDISYALDALHADIQRQKVECELSQTSERLALAANTAHIGVWDWDIVKDTMVWNDVMYDIYKLDKTVPLTIDVWKQFLIEEDLNELSEMLSSDLKSNDARDMELRILIPNNDIKTLQVVSRIIRDSDGNPLRMVGINMDVTERKQAYNDRIARVAAEQANKAKSDFLANMSHEIRTPMNAIMGYSELLQHSITNPQHRMQLASIRSSSESLLNIVNDILDISKIEAGKMKIEYSFFDIRKVLDDINQMFAKKLNEKNLFLDIIINHTVPKELMLDETRINQILINLISNSIKFTNKGRISVSVAIEMISPQVIDLVLKVGDTGIGISKDEQPYLFDPFYQTKGQLQKKYGGTGLGLSITKKFVDMMGGTIDVWSEPGNGTIFTISIPQVTFKNDGSVGEPIKHVKYRFKKAKVLVVDDNEDNRNLLCDILKQHALDVWLASTGIEAVNMASEIVPDLILMDLRMPGKTGYEASAEIKGNKKTSHIPIVAVSASPDIRIDGVLFDEFISKPIYIYKLLDILIKFLPSDDEFNKASDEPFSANATHELAPSEELGCNIPRLTKSLETKYLHDFHQAMQNQNLEQMEVFGKELQLAGLNYGCDYLANFGKKIAYLSQSGNLELALDQISLYPQLLIDLKNLHH